MVGSGAETVDVAEGRALAARLHNARLLSDALSCIYSTSRKAQDVVISIGPNGGVRFAIEQTGCLLASVLLPVSSFAEFACSDESLRIRLNLSLLLDCINVFAATSSSAPAVTSLHTPSAGDRLAVPLRLAYNGDGHPLVLVFQEPESATLCRLNTIDDDYAEDVDFRFQAHEIPNMALLQSAALRDAISELDYAGATTAELRLAPDPPRFRFQSPGSLVGLADSIMPMNKMRSKERDSSTARHATDREPNVSDDTNSALSSGVASTAFDHESGAQCEVELPDPEDRSCDVFSEFRSLREQTSVYRIELLSRCSKALSMSETSKVQMNSEGMLSIVCRMRPGLATSTTGASHIDRRSFGTGDHCFTEFLIVAEEIEDDSDNGSNIGDLHADVHSSRTMSDADE